MPCLIVLRLQLLFPRTCENTDVCTDTFFVLKKHHFKKIKTKKKFFFWCNYRLPTSFQPSSFLPFLGLLVGVVALTTPTTDMGEAITAVALV